MILPLGNQYLVQRLEPEAMTAGGIALPETALGGVYDGTVEARGPGRVANDGTQHRMQARLGDRVICQRQSWVPYDDRKLLGFVRDEKLVALVRMPEYAEVEPCGEYVIVQPERHQHLRETESGLVVAGYALQGGTVHERRRGQELYEELGRLGRSQAFLEQPTEYYRHRLVWDFCDALAPWELQALKEAIKANGDTRPQDASVMRLKDKPRCGVVVRCAQGRFARGERVHFDREYRAVDLGAHGLAIKGEFLAAVEVEAREAVAA